MAQYFILLFIENKQIQLIDKLNIFNQIKFIYNKFTSYPTIINI